MRGGVEVGAPLSHTRGRWQHFGESYCQVEVRRSEKYGESDAR